MRPNHVNNGVAWPGEKATAMTRHGHPDSRPDPTTADRLVVAAALVLPCLVTWVYFVALDGSAASYQQGAYTIGKSVQFLLPAAWVFLVRGERLALATPTWRPLVIGGLFGLAVAGAMLALYFGAFRSSALFDAAAVAVRAKVQSFGAGSPASFVLLGGFYSAIHSLLEEYYWRWFVFGQLARSRSVAAAVAVSSVGFAAHHVLVLALYFGWLSPLTWLFTLAVVVGGAVWAVLYRASGSLYAPWLSHALVDAAIFVSGYQLVMA
jgi:membrane protease YdiL (CAAX protease family)